MAGRSGERWLTLLVLPALVVGVLVLTGVTVRNSFQLEELRERSVLEATHLLALEKADRIDKRIVEQDDIIAASVDPAAWSDTTDEWLRTASLRTPTVRAVLVLDLSTPDREVVAFASRSTNGRDDERFRRVLVGTFLEELRLEAAPRRELRHLHRNHADQSHLVSYWERQVGDRRYLVVAWHDVGRIVHELFPPLAERGDQQSRVNVVDEQGRIVFGPPSSRDRLTVGRQFATTLYKWTLNVSMSSAAELARAVERRRLLEMVMVGLSALVVLAGMALILIAAARERRLAALKSDFVANVSHELKTPLSLVRMFAELLDSGRVDSEAKRKQYLAIIVSESERLGALIENVLDFAKVERGRAAYHFEEASVPDVVARAVEVCRPRFERDGKLLELTVAPGLPRSRVDERALEIAVINLLDNALKYAPDGRIVRIDVSAAGDVAAIRVTDEGPGLALEDTKRIFERFVRGRAVAGRKVRGSGIGLALVKHIAEAHGGAARVERTGPEGSTFLLTLRLAASVETSSEATRAAASAGAAATGD
ncbi:MAG: HAMP domain-containing histidine kinase [Polyangiaceae bacterium]|nr:HAMP domain-containing histidine kinase [Polyangiaceae bacterium]